MSFYSGCIITSAMFTCISLFLPSSIVLPYMMVIPEQKCVDNAGVYSYRPAHSVSSGRVVCNNGAIFYFTFENQESMKGITHGP